MVREVHLSSDCPGVLADRESFLHDDFGAGDEWESEHESSSASKPVAELADRATDRRNLAGVVTETVVVKSRRRTRGRPAKVAGRGRQISVFLSRRDWQLLRDEAARRRVAMAELCREWFRPHLERLGIERGEEGDS